MAKGANIGFLNFGIDGDNKELLKKLEQAKKEAVSIEQIFKNIKLNTGGNSISTDVQKAQLAADKMAKSQNQVTQSAMNALKAEQQLATAITNENNAKSRGVVIENQRQAALQKSLLYAKQGEAVSAESARKEALAKQKLIIEEERLNGIRKRNALIGAQGQRDLASAYGLTNKTMFSQRNILQQLSQAAGIYFSVYQVGAFIKELAVVSGEFEKQRVSLAAIIGDADAANKIFNQIKDLAVISPFNFKDLTNYAKQLSAFSIPTNEIFDTTKRLADLSAGLGVDMSRIILAYGQVRSAAVLRGQELRQFTEAGIPLVDQLAKKFSELEGRVVSAGEVFDKISNRQVSFAMIKDIITDLTSEGGKFFQMQELQSATLAGKISNLRDNYDIMLDSIGRSNQGLLHGGMDGLVELMDNWKSFVNVLYGVIAAYGVYKAAVIFNTAVKGKENVLELQSLMTAKAKEASLLRQASVYRTLTTQEQIRIAISNKLTTADLKQLAVSGSLNKESVLRLIATKQITVAQAGHLKTVLGITKAEIAQAAAMSTSGKAALFLKTSLMGVATSLKAIAMNPYTWVIAAIGGIVYALSEWNDKQKEIEATAKTISDGVISSYKTILEALKKLTPDIEISLSTSATDKGILQTVEKMRNALSDLVPKDIFSNIISELDKIPNSADKVKFLNDVLIDIKNNAENASKGIDALSSNAMDATDGWFDDSLVTNVKEYTKALLELKKAEGKMKSGQADNKGWFDNIKKQSDEAKKGVIEDLKAWSEFIQKDMFPNVQDWSKNPNLSYGSQVLLSELRDKLIEGIEGISPDVSDEITKMFNKTFWISPEIKITQQSLSTFQTAVQEAYNSLNSVNTFSLITDNPQISLASIMPQQEERAADWLSRVTGLYTDAKEQLDLYNSSLLANKIIFDDATVEGYKKQLRDIPELIKAMGMSMPSKNKGGSTKDAFAEELKKRIDLLKDARSEYDKLVKAGVSEEAAANKISKLDSFLNIDPRNFNSEVDGIIADLQKKGQKISKEQAEILRSLVLSRDTEGLAKYAEQLSKDAKSAVDKIEKELSQYKDQYSLYEYIFGKTGDKSQALKIAFGDIEGQVKTYRDALISAIEKSTDPEQKKKLQEQLVEFDFTQKSDFTKRMTDLVSEFKSVDEQITIIKAKGEETRLEIEKNADNASRDIVEQRLRANQESVNKQVLDLTNGILQATDSYQRLFGDIADISQKELQYLIDKWKTALANATKNSVGNMVISIDGKEFETTEKEISNFTKRVLKTETELRSRNPFKALKDSFNELKNNQSDIARIKAEIASLYASIKLAENSKSAGSKDPLNDLIISSSNGKITELQNNLKNLDAKGATGLQKMGTAIGAIGTGISDISQSLSGMFDSLGNEELADTIGLVGELAGAAADIGQGLASKNPVQVIQGIAKGISSIANFHDKKLDRAIKKSQLEVKRLQNAYESVSRFIERKLGAITSSQAKQQIDNLKRQRQELIKQQEAESKKKKKDQSAIEDYKASISELGDKIAYFYEDLFKELYNFDFKSIADQISSALVDAFKSGEDAAKAFDNTVADIINKLAADMISLQIIQPAMEKIRDYLFGSKGVFMDGELSLSDAKGLVGLMGGLSDSISQGKVIWDALNEAAKEAGINLSEQSNKDTLSKGTQSITEDTGNLLGSYINAMRAEQARQGVLISNIIAISQTHTDQFANMYAELLRIQVNTLATANNTSRLVTLTEEIKSASSNTNMILQKATLKGSGTSFNL